MESHRDNQSKPPQWYADRALSGECIVDVVSDVGEAYRGAAAALTVALKPLDAARFTTEEGLRLKCQRSACVGEVITRWVAGRQPTAPVDSMRCLKRNTLNMPPLF